MVGWLGKQVRNIVKLRLINNTQFLERDDD